MRFITEYTLKYEDGGNHQDEVRLISGCEIKMGEMLSNAFGWQKTGKRLLNGLALERRKIEIEAFPMDKWMAFKTKLFHRLLQDNISTTYYDRITEELESFGKPEGTAKEM